MEHRRRRARPSGMLADELIRRLRDRFAPGGFLHYGQGKWYPGEALPRWAFALYWRRDGEPIWRDPALIARESGRPSGPACADACAAVRAKGVAERLGIDAEYVMPAYEDPAHWILKEARAPGERRSERSQARGSRGARPHRARLRARARQAGGLRAAGAALERAGGRRRLDEREAGGCGASRLFLVPGDSPVGFRLPLDSLPHVADRRRLSRIIAPADPFARRATAARRARAGGARLAPRHGQTADAPTIAGPQRRAPGPRRAGRRVVRRRCARPSPSSCATACSACSCRRSSGSRTISSCSPPSRRRAARAQPAGAHRRLSAAARSAPRRHQGHARSRRHRGQRPSGRELARSVDITRDALRGGAPDPARHRQVHDRRPAHRHRRRQSRRARRRDAGRQPVPAPARSAQEPGRSTGSAIPRCPICSPACSSARPARRRASTRRATTASTSSRSRSRMVPAPDDGEAPPPWLVDRLFRNLLVDVTGNTHRAEICIDKLFSPDGPTGRLGLVEFRSFEMPPDARMSLAQQLLLRALIAWFWREPQRRRAGALGHGAARPLHAAAFRLGGFPRRCSTTCARAGYAFDAALVRGAARVPLSRSTARSTMAASSSSCARRSSPGTCWARKATAGGTVRFVDSSVERLQVKVEGFNAGAPRRHLQRPARAADVATGTVAARTSPACASRPGSRRPACTRPSPVHAPLTFDIIDTLERPLARRLRLSRRPSRRPQLRDLPGQLLRGRGAAAGALPGHRPHAGLRRRPPAKTARSSIPLTLDLRRPVLMADAPPGTRIMALDASAERRRRLRPLLAGYRAAAGHLRRAGRRRRPRAPALAAVPGGARGDRAGGDRARASPRRTGICATPASSIASTTTRRRRAAMAAGHVPLAASPRPSGSVHRGRARLSAPTARSACWPTSTAPAALVREGALPAAVIAGNPEFLRPLRRRRSRRGGCAPRFYAADLGRAPDGHWWVLGDRTQAPSGIGLCAGEPARHLARPARLLSRAAGRAAGAVLPGACRPRWRRQPARRLRASRCSRRGR